MLGFVVFIVDLNLFFEVWFVIFFLSLFQVFGLQLFGEGEEEEEGEDDGVLGDEVVFEDSEEVVGLVFGCWCEDVIDWQCMFSVGVVDFELLCLDWNDLWCNVLGNFQLLEVEVVDVVVQYMEWFNVCYGGCFVFLCIVNVEKCWDLV